MKKILCDCIVSHYQPPLILSPPIDRRPKKLENRTRSCPRRSNSSRLPHPPSAARGKCGIQKVKNHTPPNTQGGCAMHFVVKYVSVPWMLILSRLFALQNWELQLSMTRANHYKMHCTTPFFCQVPRWQPKPALQNPCQPSVSSVNVEISMHIYPHRFKSQHILPKKSQEGQKFEICSLYNYMVTTESEPPPPSLYRITCHYKITN